MMMKKILMLIFVMSVAFPTYLSSQDLDVATLAKREGSKKGVQLKAPITGVWSDRVSVGIGYKYSF